jgi:hypothetical protein
MRQSRPKAACVWGLIASNPAEQAQNGARDAVPSFRTKGPLIPSNSEAQPKLAVFHCLVQLEFGDCTRHISIGVACERIGTQAFFERNERLVRLGH